MYHHLFVLIVVFVTAPFVLCADLTPLRELTWTYMDEPEGGRWHGLLEFAPYTFTRSNGATLTTRAYKRPEDSTATIPGPLIRMKRGETYYLTIKNTLAASTTSSTMNIYKEHNVTNLHVHGLHVFPDDFHGTGYSGDNVFTSVNGGGYHTYVYYIPKTHTGGTYWYHPHHHGSTTLQVAGGAAGMIIIDDDGTIGREINEIPDSVTAMTELNLVAQYIDSSVASTTGDTYMKASGSITGWYVNGAWKPYININSNEWVRMRLLVVEHQGTPYTFSFDSQCTVAVLAYDGVYLSSIPRVVSSLTLTGASRADFAFKCSGSGTYGWYARHPTTGVSNVVTYIVAGSTGSSTPSPYNNGNTWSPVYGTGHYLTSLEASAGNYKSITLSGTSINGVTYSGSTNYLYTLTAGQVEQWYVDASTSHPFHLHTAHVQIQDATCGQYQRGDWVDTLANPCNVKFRVPYYQGRMPMHCHNLMHGDQGMMAVNYVQKGDASGVQYCGDLSCNIGENRTTCPDCCVANKDTGSTSSWSIKQMIDGKYLCVRASDSMVIYRTATSTCTTISTEILGTNLFALKSNLNSKYLRCTNGFLKADTTTISLGAKFELRNYGSHFRIMNNSNGKFWKKMSRIINYNWFDKEWYVGCETIGDTVDNMSNYDVECSL